MKLITAIIRPEKLPEVKAELAKVKVTNMTVSNVIGCGRQEGELMIYRGIGAEVELHKKVRLDIGVNDDFVSKTINAIRKSAKTGKLGDGVIWVTDVVDFHRIRTGEKGKTAIG
jgi:nitrogen regulatory protein P-II 2